ncbi:MAG TPA: MalM family protein [Rhodanobacteraceae bacterium]
MLHRTLPRLGLVILPLLLAACATGLPLHASHPGDAETSSLTQARTALAKAPLCCTQFSQFDFSHTLPDKLKRFTIGPKRPVADFNGSRSWFLAFQLPDDDKTPYDVLFKSTLTGRWLDHSYLFAPSVVLLDAAYQPLRTQDVQLCEYMGWTRAKSGAFGHVTVKNPDARYLVVYSSGAQLTGNTYWEQSPTTFSTNQPVQMASSGSFQIPHGPNGVLYVGKLTNDYRKTVNNAICGQPNANAATGVFSMLGHLLHRSHPTTAIAD